MEHGGWPETDVAGAQEIPQKKCAMLGYGDMEEHSAFNIRHSDFPCVSVPLWFSLVFHFIPIFHLCGCGRPRRLPV